jgi:hypothetical protein
VEPYRLRQWRVGAGRLFTCGRPGRDKYKEATKVPDKVIHDWVRKLPGSDKVIVSLLGRKPDGTSEFSFYPFYGGFDTVDQPCGRTSFQQWLNEHYPELDIEVCEHPTEDFRKIPEKTLAAVAHEIDHALAAGKTVVLIDSGGQTRTGAICSYMRLQEQFV